MEETVKAPFTDDELPEEWDRYGDDRSWDWHFGSKAAVIAGEDDVAPKCRPA